MNPTQLLLRDPVKYKALKSHKTCGAAIDFARKVGNVAFVRHGVPLTCTRTYVSDCLNAGQRIAVLADFEED